MNGALRVAFRIVVSLEGHHGGGEVGWKQVSGEKGTNKRRHPCGLLGIPWQGREGAKDIEETGGALVTFPVTGPSSACVCSQNSALPLRTEAMREKEEAEFRDWAADS